MISFNFYGVGNEMFNSPSFWWLLLLVPSFSGLLELTVQLVCMYACMYVCMYVCSCYRHAMLSCSGSERVRPVRHRRRHRAGSQDEPPPARCRRPRRPAAAPVPPGGRCDTAIGQALQQHTYTPPQLPLRQHRSSSPRGWSRSWSRWAGAGAGAGRAGLAGLAVRAAAVGRHVAAGAGEPGPAQRIRQLAQQFHLCKQRYLLYLSCVYARASLVRAMYCYCYRITTTSRATTVRGLGRGTAGTYRASLGALLGKTIHESSPSFDFAFI